MPVENYEELLERYKANDCSPEEIAFIESWYVTYQEGSLYEDLSLSEREKDLNLVSERLGLPEPVKVAKLWPRLGIAAAIFMVIGIGIYFYSRNDRYPVEEYANDIPSKGKNTATLTLSSGEKIELSNVKAGKLADQAGIQVSKTREGQLVYEGKAPVSSKADTWNTLSTANGEQYSVQLPDGTKVWLNSASALKYPASFASLKERRVQLTGEAYFEVAKDKLHPFVVKTEQQEVTVLGTHFNVSSYMEDHKTITTLLEGSVKVDALYALQSRVIRPGEEVLNADQQLLIRPADLKAAMAWKEGYFRFNNESLERIMNQVSRWYDVDVVYQGNRNQLASLTFWGIVSRDKNVSEVLKMIERAEKVKFIIKGRTITVMSN